MTTREGYQPTEKLDTSKPPQDTTGVPDDRPSVFETKAIEWMVKRIKENISREIIDDAKAIGRYKLVMGVDTLKLSLVLTPTSVKNPDTSGRECQ